MTNAHAPGCSDDECSRTYGDTEISFVCVRCERRVGLCLGCHDEMPALCDDCAATIGWPDE